MSTDNVDTPDEDQPPRPQTTESAEATAQGAEPPAPRRRTCVRQQRLAEGERS